MTPAGPDTPLRIGITVGVAGPGDSMWSNGIKQNAVFLAEALKHVPRVQSVQLINTGPPTEVLPWDAARWPTVSFESAKDSLEVVIELGAQVGHEATAYLKERGARLISYCCGSEYVTTMESVLFGKGGFGANLYVNQRYDAIWMVPQVAALNAPYFTTLRRRPAQAVPFVWDPVFLTARAAELPDAGEYRPRPGPRRVSVMEPNINVVKFCLYPIFIIEEVYRKRPDLIERMQVTNTERIARDSHEFIALMNQLDVVKEHKAVFLPRYATPEFLSQMTDAVVSHQWENPLNYFYLEVCWQGYPLVHNAHLCADLGYYYPANDTDHGSRVLLDALERHDSAWEAYRQRQRSIIDRYLASNARVTAQYDALLNQLTSVAPI